MGTNYYVHPAPCPNPCAHCRAPEEIHLGKSNAGWAFTFRAYPPIEDTDRSEIGPVVTDYTSWLTLLDLGEISDEYGRPWTAEDLLAKIDGKRGGRNVISGGGDFVDDDGHRFLPCDFC